MEATQTDPRAVGSAPRPEHAYHALRVRRVVRETRDACSLVLEIPPQLASVFRYRAGQFLTLEVEHEGKRLKRCYSLASAPEVDAEPKITIKRVSGGRISNWVNDAVREGDVIHVLPPEGRFVMSRDATHMTLFAGGSGITPVISIVKSALASTQRSITLVYANRVAASVIFRAELDELASRHAPRLTVAHRFDDVHGFLRIADVGQYVGPDVLGEYFVCGPSPFMDTVEHGLRARGVSSDRIHVERFVSPTDPKSDAERELEAQGEEIPTSVHVELAGKKHDVPYARGKTLLRAALDAGLDAPYSCEEGFCGCCTARLVEGEVHMAEDEALTAEEKKRGYVLTCQARPTSRSCSIKFLDI